jgi:hypothetical protein
VDPRAKDEVLLNQKKPVTIGDYLKGDKRKESREHAQEGGVVTGVIDRAGAAARRRARLKDKPTVPGKDRDEHPPAVIKPDNEADVSIKPIDPSDNRSSGAGIREELKNLPDGTRVRA